MTMYKVDKEGNWLQQTNNEEGHLEWEEISNPLEDLNMKVIGKEESTNYEDENYFKKYLVIGLGGLVVSVFSVLLSQLFQEPAVQLSFTINDVYIGQTNQKLEKIIEEKVTILKEELLKNIKSVDSLKQLQQDMPAGN